MFNSYVPDQKLLRTGSAWLKFVIVVDLRNSVQCSSTHIIQYSRHILINATIKVCKYIALKDSSQVNKWHKINSFTENLKLKTTRAAVLKTCI
jgi:hypothetical protein